MASRQADPKVTSAAQGSRGRGRALTIVAATLAILVGWTAIVGMGSIEGWWRKPLAPHGDREAFVAAASKLIDREKRGEIVFVLVENGRIVAEHDASIGQPVNRDTRFQLASVSKWVAALGVMTLVEAGKIDLDAPVETYLKRWKLPPSEFDHRRVTVRRLLSHTGGLVDGLGYGGFLPSQRVQTLAESLTRAGDAKPGEAGETKVGQQPGDQWAYSGGGYAMLEMMIEDVTGEPFAAYMQRAVLNPLGMTNSTFVPLESGAPNLATNFDAGGNQIPYRKFSATSAAGLFATAADMARLIEMHRPGPDGSPAGRGILKPSTLEEMRKPHGYAFGTDIWGLGVLRFASNNQGDSIVGHDGENYPAINTTARFDPATGDGIIVLTDGAPGISDRLGSEWIFWRTGNVDKPTVLNEAPQTLLIVAIGWLLILGVGGYLAWRAGKRAIRL